MYIYLKKFGTVLTSRQTGKEAFAAFQPALSSVAKNEEIVIDFDGVDVLSPSWGDEFLTPLKQRQDVKIVLKNTNNSSVCATLKMLEEIHKYKFRVL